MDNLFTVDGRPEHTEIAAPIGLNLESLGSPFHIGSSLSVCLVELLHPSIPNSIGQLGEVVPVHGPTESVTWVIEELKSYPRAYAQLGQTAFIHRNIVSNSLLPPSRTALGICSACVYMNEANEPLIFRTIEAEVSELVRGKSGSTLLEELSKMQAMVLYTIIRLFSGDVEKRICAEQQRFLLGIWGMRLLQRADMELSQAQVCWNTWILTESVRRTVLIAHVAYGAYSIAQYGICAELPTLAVLPLSTKQVFWHSQTTYFDHFLEDETKSYAEFTDLWLASTARSLESFEKLLLVACRGLDAVETYDRECWTTADSDRSIT